MFPIIETYQITGAGSHTDILKAPSRLAAIPYNGSLTLEFSSTNLDMANSANLVIQLPSGEVPIDQQAILANGYSETDDVIHNSTSEVYTFTATQGGHFLIDIGITGDITRVIMKATLIPG